MNSKPEPTQSTTFTVNLTCALKIVNRLISEMIYHMTWLSVKLLASACFSHFLSGPYTLGRSLCYTHLNPCFRCSGLDKNVKTFSSAVVPLADSLKGSSGVAVKRAIACALERLSRDPYNCFLIHQHDALKVKWFLTEVNLLRLLQGAWISPCKKNWPKNIYSDDVIGCYSVMSWWFSPFPSPLS